MTGQYLTIECKQQFHMCEGLAKFTEYLASQAQQWGANFATAIRKVEVADAVGKDTRTITRYINQLQDLGLADIETKRGRNGGTVVVFNNDLLNFEPTDNPVTSETKKATEIREQVFPTVPKKTPKRRYRSKAQIAEERALRKRSKNEAVRLNDLLEATPVLTRDFFDNFENPQEVFRGYLLAQMYTAYAVIFPKNRHEFYADIDASKSQSALKAFNKAKGYNVLDDRFVGTPQFNKFIEVAKYLDEHEINPLSYLTVQFQYAEWLASNGYARKEAIPYVNSLLSKDAVERYYKNAEFIRQQRKKHLFELSTYTVPFIGSNYPLIQALLEGYLDDRKKSEQVDIVIDRLLNRDLFDMSIKREVLADYYVTVTDAIAESDLDGEEQVKLTQFIKEQVAVYAERGGISAKHFALAFPLQIMSIRSTAMMKNLSHEDYCCYLGNIHKSMLYTDEQWNDCVAKGEVIDFSHNANETFLSTSRLLADCQGLGLLPNELHGILAKFGVEKVPLDVFGMLDVNRIYKDQISEEDLLAEEQREQNSYIRI